MNQVAIWFRVIRRKVTRFGNFESLENLRNSQRQFIDYHNDRSRHRARPSTNTYGVRDAGYKLKQSFRLLRITSADVRSFCQNQMSTAKQFVCFLHGSLKTQLGTRLHCFCLDQTAISTPCGGIRRKVTNFLGFFFWLFQSQIIRMGFAVCRIKHRKRGCE